jgi:hypothetical protein
VALKTVEVLEAVLVTVVVEVGGRRMVVATEDVLGDGVGMDVDVTVGATYTVAVELSTHPTS